MSDQRTNDGARRWAKGVVIVGLLAALLGACGMGGKSQATAADARFEQINDVVAASTVVSRPGLPTNTNYSSKITMVGGLSDADLARVIDEALVVARDELGPTSNGGADLFFRTDGGSIDLKVVIPLLGDVGNQFSLSEGSLVFSQAELKAYVSPSEGS